MTTCTQSPPEKAKSGWIVGRELSAGLDRSGQPGRSRIIFLDSVMEGVSGSESGIRGRAGLYFNAYFDYLGA